jgi:hypothetical protein
VSGRRIPCGGDQGVDHAGGPGIERPRSAGHHDAPRLLWLATHGDHPDAVGQHVGHDRGDRRDGQARGDDTDASRPWFDDMSSAQTPTEAARWPVELVLGASFDPAFYGELVQFGKVLPWETGIPVAHNAA